MDQIARGDFKANGLWCAIGLIVFSLTQAEKLLFLGLEWKSNTPGTLCWLLIGVASRN